MDQFITPNARRILKEYDTKACRSVGCERDLWTPSLCGNSQAAGRGHLWWTTKAALPSCWRT